MTRKIFWEDPYLTSLQTTVAAVDRAEVRLAETIFFAFSGGQERDYGTIGGYEVGDARWEGHDLLYGLAPGHTLRPGAEVEVRIDADRRAALRRLHMAAEIVLELATQDDAALVRSGAHIGANKARLDFACEEPIGPRLPRLEAAANRMVADDVAIISAFSDEAAERRYWEIADFARVPCSGTHPRRTGEIGPVQLRRYNPGRGRERIEITLPESARP